MVTFHSYVGLPKGIMTVREVGGSKVHDLLNLLPIKEDMLTQCVEPKNHLGKRDLN